MIDPVTAVAAATKAYSAIKWCVEQGQDAEAVLTQVGKWYGAASDVLYDEKKKSNPNPFKRIVFAKSAEQEAFDALVRKRKIDKQRQEIISLVGLVYGKEAVAELRSIREQVIREREALVYKQQELREGVMYGVAIIGCVALLVGLIGFMLS